MRRVRLVGLVLVVTTVGCVPSSSRPERGPTATSGGEQAEPATVEEDERRERPPAEEDPAAQPASPSPPPPRVADDASPTGQGSPAQGYAPSQPEPAPRAQEALTVEAGATYAAAAPPADGWAQCRAGTPAELQARPYYVALLQQSARTPGSVARVAAARALALLGEAEGVRVLEELHRADPEDGFVLASLVLADAEAPRAEALERFERARPSEAVLLAFGFTRRPDSRVTLRLRAQLDAGTLPPSTRDFARAALAEMYEPRAMAEVRALIVARAGTAPDHVASEAGAILGWDPALARPVLEAALHMPESDAWATAGVAFGRFPQSADPALLARAHAHSRDEIARVWLGYAILRLCGGA